MAHRTALPDTSRVAANSSNAWGWHAPTQCVRREPKPTSERLIGIDEVRGPLLKLCHCSFELVGTSEQTFLQPRLQLERFTGAVRCLFEQLLCSTDGMWV